jgi:hypothetical protein
MIITPLVVGLILVGIFMPARQLTIEGFGTISFETTVTLSVGSQAAYASPGWLSGWTYRRPINLSQVTPVDDYQVLVTLTTGTMGNPYANVKPDGSDIRFTGSDEVTLQDYWIESWDNTGTSRIWVEVKTSGTSTIYMYYGNAAASSTSDANATFVFFDDFESGNLNKWTMVSDTFWSVATNQKHSGTHSLKAGATSSSDKYISATGINQTDVLFDAWWYNTATTPDIAQNVRACTALPLNDYHINWEGQWTIAEMPWNPLSSVAGSLPQNTWFKMTVIIQGTSMKVLIDDVQVNPVSGWLDVGTKYASGSIGFRAWTAGNNWWIDDCLVRKYTSPEPVAAVGSEEPDISNIPSSKNFGTVAESSDYWSNDGAPTFPLDDGECYFTVTNNSSAAVNIQIKATDFAGGVGWTLTSGSPGQNTVRMKAGKSGDSTEGDMVTLTNGDQGFISGLAASASKAWELKLETGTFTDVAAKTSTITLTASIA